MVCVLRGDETAEMALKTVPPAERRTPLTRLLL